MAKPSWWNKGFGVFLRRHYHFIAQAFLGYSEYETRTRTHKFQHPLLEDNPPLMKEVRAGEWLALPLWPIIYIGTLSFVFCVNAWETAQASFATLVSIPENYSESNFARSVEKAKNKKGTLFQAVCGFPGIVLGFVGAFVASISLHVAANVKESGFFLAFKDLDNGCHGYQNESTFKLSGSMDKPTSSNPLTYVLGLAAGLVFFTLYESWLSFKFMSYSMVGRALHKRYIGKTLSADTNHQRSFFARFLGAPGWLLGFLVATPIASLVYIVRKGVIPPLVKLALSPLVFLVKGLSKLYKTLAKKRRFDHVNKLMAEPELKAEALEEKKEEEDEEDITPLLSEQDNHYQMPNATKKIIHRFKELYESLNVFGELRGHRLRDEYGRCQRLRDSYIYRVSGFKEDDVIGQQGLGAFFILAMNLNQQTPTKILLDEVWKAFEAVVDWDKAHPQEETQLRASLLPSEATKHLKEQWNHQGAYATGGFFENILPPDNLRLFRDAITIAKRRCGIGRMKGVMADFSYQFATSDQKKAYEKEIDNAVEQIKALMLRNERVIKCHPLNLHKPLWSPMAFFGEHNANSKNVPLGRPLLSNSRPEYTGHENNSTSGSSFGCASRLWSSCKEAFLSSSESKGKYGGFHGNVDQASSSGEHERSLMGIEEYDF